MDRIALQCFHNLTEGEISPFRRKVLGFDAVQVVAEEGVVEVAGDVFFFQLGKELFAFLVVFGVKGFQRL